MNRARDRGGTPIPPMTLANMRALGVRRLEAICENTLCGHAGVVEVDALPGEIPVPDVAGRSRCSRCGGKTVSTRPLWTEYRASGTARR